MLVLFNNDAPLAVYDAMTGAEQLKIINGMEKLERKRLRSSSVKEIDMHMRRCYFHFHDVPYIRDK